MIRSRGIAQICFLIVVILFLGSCHDSLSIHSLRHDNSLNAVSKESFGEAGQVPVRLLLGDLGNARTIAPTQLTAVELNNTVVYSLQLDGSSDMGDTRSVPDFTINNDGLGTLLLTPGNWELTLTVTEKAGNTQILMGKSSVKVENKPTATAMVLTPLSGNGRVAVDFVLSASIIKRLDKDTANQATITVALYDTTGTEVPGTKKEFKQAVPTTATATLNYTANDMQLPAGRYSIKLVSSYTVNNVSTLYMDAKYTMGYEDVLYVEAARVSQATVELSSNSQELGNPNNPARAEKKNLNGSSSSGANHNFTQSTQFRPWGETVWMYSFNWDGENNGTQNGNEVLIVNWEPVYNADYYEVEVLFHPFSVTTAGSGTVVTPNPYGKFNRVVYTDEEWEVLRNTDFTYTHSGVTHTKKPSLVQFSGDPNSPHYYRTHSLTIDYVIKSTGAVSKFLTCADKNLARSIFADPSKTTGMGNASYRVSAYSATNNFDTYGIYEYVNGGRRYGTGKIGLEGDCSNLGILTPSFAPRISVAFRVRAVNEYGHSDWVYWKGGKW